MIIREKERERAALSFMRNSLINISFNALRGLILYFRAESKVESYLLCYGPLVPMLLGKMLEIDTFV